MDLRTWRWWTGLRLVSVFNILAWLSLLAIYGQPSENGPEQLIASALFVGICAFRSFFPRVDLERTALIDHPISGIVLGRSAATLAEMAFATQTALILDSLAGGESSSWIAWAAWVLVPLIAAAQMACWTAVLTLNHLWHATEEALWSIYVAIIAAVFIAIWPRTDSTFMQGLLAFGIFACLAAGTLMSGIDVPMYFQRYREHKARGEKFLTLREGFWDALRRRQPDQSWATWRPEVPWMSLYFSAAVWLSLLMAWLPIHQYFRR